MTTAGKTLFTRATKAQAKARLALVGPAGSGKTYTALAVGSRIAERCQGSLAVIDTEHGSASLYADTFQFDALALSNHDPRRYIEAIQAAGTAGYAVLVIDSLSHAWMGQDGALEQVDKAAARSSSGNTFAAWRQVTPLHNKLVDAILACQCHVIATLRSKTEWVLEEGRNGKQTPRRVGMAPIMRDGIEYEFTLAGDLSIEHQLVITKSRCAGLADAVIDRPGAPFADALFDWLEAGTPAVAAPLPRPAAGTKADRQDDAAVRQDVGEAQRTNAERLSAAVRQTADELGMDAEARKAVRTHWFEMWKAVKAEAGYGDEPLEELPFDVMDELLLVFREAISTEGGPTA